jgi:glycosyltransferase involved in cell wall biosynthesis
MDNACSISLSLIICSRNRAEALGNCLKAINSEEMRAVGGELILVNNGSTDKTEAVMLCFQKCVSFPVEIVNETTPGLARARNSGLAKARGETIVFTDDDCYLEPGFLLKAAAVFAKGQFDYCGGRILLYDEHDSPYGCDLREDFHLIPKHSFVSPGEFQGANMVVHRRVVEKIRGFDAMLGAGTPFRCEDIEYCARASMAGFVGAHVPELVIYHHHGRKPGAEIGALGKANDYARGAYYMKFLLQGKLKYLTGWFKLSLDWREWRMTVREIHGALDYLLSRTFAVVKGR